MEDTSTKSTNKGNTALHYAYEYKYTEIVQYLEAKGADKKKRNKLGYLPWEGIRKTITDYYDLAQYQDE